GAQQSHRLIGRKSFYNPPCAAGRRLSGTVVSGKQTVNRPLKIDVHIHLAGNGCCNSGIWLSKKCQHRYTYRALRRLQKITKQQEETTIDRDWAERISKIVGESTVDYGVVLGFDGVFSDKNGAWNENLSQMMIPPQWVFKV